MGAQGNTTALAFDLALFAPVGWVKGLESLGRIRYLRGFITSIEATTNLGENAAFRWLAERGLSVFANERALRTALSHTGQVVDLIAHNPSTGRLVLAEAKTTLGSSELGQMFGKVVDTVDTLEKHWARGGVAFPGVEEIIITYKKVKDSGLGSYVIDAAGYVYYQGTKIFIAGIPLIAKLVD